MTTSIGTTPRTDGLAFEEFPALAALPWLRHVFTRRQPGVPIGEDRTETLGNLKRTHDEILEHRGMPHRALAAAEQVHGAQVGWIDQKPRLPVAGADGLATRAAGLPIGVYVADCCAVFLVDVRRRAIAVLHSGLKGTQQNIAGAGVGLLVGNHASDPADLLAVLSPCIRGCCYREEFADRIVSQLEAEKVGRIVRHDRCTACHVDAYYSYSREKGRTGRMLAALMIAPEGG